MSDTTTDLAVAGVRSSRLKSLAVLGLLGSVAGMLTSVAAVEKPGMATSLVGAVIGGGLALAGYGFWIKGGGGEFWRNPLVEGTTPAGFMGIRVEKRMRERVHVPGTGR